MNKKLKPADLVAAYDLWPGNGEDPIFVIAHEAHTGQMLWSGVVIILDMKIRFWH